jgi:hypothetical protein
MKNSAILSLNGRRFNLPSFPTMTIKEETALGICGQVLYKEAIRGNTVRIDGSVFSSNKGGLSESVCGHRLQVYPLLYSFELENIFDELENRLGISWAGNWTEGLSALATAMKLRMPMGGKVVLSPYRPRGKWYESVRIFIGFRKNDGTVLITDSSVLRPQLTESFSIDSPKLLLGTGDMIIGLPLEK